MAEITIYACSGNAGNQVIFNKLFVVGKVLNMAEYYGDYPCYRVVNHNGRLVPGWAEQKGLLSAENITFKDNGCVDLKAHQWNC